MRIGKTVKSVLWFELVWKLIVLGVVNPLFREIYQTYVASVGVSFNKNMLGTFFNLKGGVIFLLLFFGAAGLIFYEYCAVINITVCCWRGEPVSFKQVLRRSLWDLGTLRGWSLVPGSIYYVLLLPLVHIGYVNSMVQQVTIPWFIFGELQKKAFGGLGILAVYIAYLGLDLLLVFTPVCMVLGHRTMAAAARESLRCWKMAGWKVRLKIAAILVAWERVMTEIARYWRRNVLGSNDFDGNFLKYLVCSEAFRKDLLYWLLLTLLQTAGLAVFVYAVVSFMLGAGEKQVPADWTGDAGTVLEIAGRHWAVFVERWRKRLKNWRWKAGAGLVCLVLAGWLVLTCWLPLPVHRPLAIGHRGCCFAVENTLEAVMLAAEAGADCAEIDVQLTRDGVPVLFHDGSLTRMAGRSERIGELSWDELREIPIDDYRHPDAGVRISSLEEVLTALRGHPSRMGLLIELKPETGRGDALASAIMELAERYEFGERTMFMSLDYACLVPILERHPEWWVGYCAYSVAGDIDDSVWRYGVDFLAVEEQLVSNRLVTKAREQDLPVYVWSVYDAEKMQQYLEMGVSGLISDYPNDAAKVVDAYRKSHPEAEYRVQ